MNEEEVIRTAMDAWNERGFGAFAEHLAPDVVWHAPPDYPEGDVWRGRDAIVKAWQAQYDSVFSESHTEITELTEAPRGWFVALRAVAKAHGSELEWQSFFVGRVESELWQELWVFNDRDAAERQAGLS